MTKKYTYILWVLGVCIGGMSCSNDNGYTPVEPDPVSPVVFDLNEYPFETLSEYNFFEGDLSSLDPVYGVLPFTLNSTLFTDYAKKKRFVWMPDNQQAAYVADAEILEFPVGAILIKNFYYDNVLPENRTMIIETRLMYKTETGWAFANYLWNDEQTEAYFYLTTESSFVSFDWLENGVQKSVNYKVPRFAECFTCHNKYDTPFPIGPKPQNLDLNYAFEDGAMNQLGKWIEQGYLDGSNLPSSINAVANWKDTSESLENRVRSYLDINCAHCHSDQSYCDYAHMRFCL